MKAHLVTIGLILLAMTIVTIAVKLPDLFAVLVGIFLAVMSYIGVYEVVKIELDYRRYK